MPKKIQIQFGDKNPATKPKAVRARLSFAERRLEELKELDADGRIFTDAQLRQQLVQEFFFHLVGAVDFLAQVVNDRKDIALDVQEVTVWKVCEQLGSGDPVELLLAQLHPTVKGRQCPPDPYSDDGQHFRVMVFRHRVCHHGQNPFFFRHGAKLRAHLFIDPRDYESGRSDKPAIDELNDFWCLMSDKCEEVLRHL